MTIPAEWFESNPFVYACATGNMAEIKSRLAAGEDINQIATEAKYLGAQTSGLGAAISTHRLDVIDLLIESGADMTVLKWDHMNKRPFSGVTVFDVAVESYFWEGVDHFIKKYGLSLSSSREDINQLLFSAIPKPTRIHHFSPGANPDAIAEARRLDGEDRENALATFDYLIDELGLDVDVELNGMTLLTYANGDANAGFWGDQGITLEHLLKRGCNPNLEAMASEPKFSVGISKQASEKINEVFADVVKGEVPSSETTDSDADEGLLSTFMEWPELEESDEEGDDIIVLGGPDTLYTTGLIGACYNPCPKAIDIYMRDERSDPLHRDKHGMNAFDMLNMSSRTGYKEADANIELVRSKLTAQVKRIHGYDYFDLAAKSKGLRPN